MPRSFDMAAEYGGSVEQVHRAFSDEQYWLVRLADSGADDATLDSMTIGDDGSIDIITTQTLRVDRLPAVVTQFHRGDLSFRREERWSPVVDNQATVTVKGTILRAPATLVGDGVLAPAAGGSRLGLKTTVQVDIPLVGGKIENFIGSQLVDLLIAEQRFTSTWIAESA